MVVHGDLDAPLSTAYAARMIEPQPLWDPLAALPSGEPSGSFRAKWKERLWLNVPGPFYTGETDTCWTGRLSAPLHVAYGGEYFTEFVYRQPKTSTEVAALAEAAWADPFGGYACDGDQHWAPETVRAWWLDRARVEKHVAGLLASWEVSPRSDEQEACEGLRDFLRYLTNGLEVDLRAYLFRLEQGRYPAADDRLPEL
jgi:hypothetical protein